MGDWIVHPLEGRLEGVDSDSRVQPKSMDVLLCLARNAGSVVERDSILQEVWAGRAQSDEPLTRCISELRRALGDARDEPAYIQTVPKRGYLLLKPVEALPDTNTVDDDADDATSLTPAQKDLRFGTLEKLGIGALVIIAAVFAETLVERLIDSSWTNGEGSVSIPEKSIAVLPFINMSSDEEQEWFADGLTEELLTTLSRTPDLMVSSRTSSFYYKDSDADIRTIAEQLGVAHVIEGSVRRSSDRVRVTAQLIRAADGFHIWSESFDKSLDDVIALQEELAYAIANAMETAMDSEALAAMVSAGTKSVATYELYLEAIARYNRFSSNGDPEDIRAAMSTLEEAAAIDPGFAAAHYRLAEAWRGQLAINSFSLPMPGMSYTDQKQRFTTSIEAAIDAAKYTPERNLYEAKLAQVNLRFREAVRAYRDYLDARPSDYEAWFWLSQVYQQMGDYENAFDAVDRAASHPGLDTALDPRLIYAYSRTGHTREGMKAGQRLIALVPTHATALYQAHRALLLEGMVTEAAELLPRIQASDLYNNQIALAAGRQACAEGRVADAEAGFNSTELRELSWIFLQILGRPEDAAEVLSHLDVAARHYQLSNFMVYPEFDATYFPNLQLVLDREHVQRPPPTEILYACAH